MLRSPLFQKYGVDLYLGGHLHNYERTLPVLSGSAVQADYVDPTATVHVVVGMGGDDEGLTDRWFTPLPAWSVRQVAALGWARLTFSWHELLFEFVLSEGGAVNDSFVISKSKSHNETNATATAGGPSAR